MDLSALKFLVLEWTQKAQSGSCSDDEKNTYYECAKQLHENINRIEERYEQ